MDGEVIVDVVVNEPEGAREGHGEGEGESEDCD